MPSLPSALETRCLQLVEPWRAAATPSSAVHVSEMRGCIPRPKCALPPGLIGDWVGKKRVAGGSVVGEGGGRRGSGCTIRAAHVSKSETVCGIGRVGDSGLSRCTSPRDESATRIPSYPHPQHTSYPYISLSLSLSQCFVEAFSCEVHVCIASNLGSIDVGLLGNQKIPKGLVCASLEK